MAKTTLKQQTSTPVKSQVDRLENLVIVVPHGDAEDWPHFPYADILRNRVEKRGKPLKDAPFFTVLPNAAGTRVTLLSATPDVSPFERLTTARKIAATHLDAGITSIALYLPGVDEALAHGYIEAVCAALLAGDFDLADFKSRKDHRKHLKVIQLLGLYRRLDLSRTFAEAEGNNLARYLTALPANELSPGLYRARIQDLAKAHGWKNAFLDLKRLGKMKAGAFIAVAQGSPVPDAGIAHLRYDPPKPSKKPPLALVGKGICFDTGGTNLKAAKHMLGMHVDMEGSAVALGTLLALTQLKVDFPIDCWLALAENHLGPKAYRQNEVVTACDGTTIEIVHTDAEGRMVLADTLALASRKQPGFIIDYATLTGACIYALGTAYSGAFTNREALNPALIQAGRDSGERVWPFPMDRDYDEELESDVADVKQCTIGGEADHILAARFLKRFVAKGIPWVHVDLAAGTRKGGLGHVATDITGFGVRFTLSLLFDQGGVL